MKNLPPNLLFLQFDTANIVLLWRHTFRDRRKEGWKKISLKEMGKMGLSFPLFLSLSQNFWRHNRIKWALSAISKEISYISRIHLNPVDRNRFSSIRNYIQLSTNIKMYNHKIKIIFFSPEVPKAWTGLFLIIVHSISAESSL